MRFLKYFALVLGLFAATIALAGVLHLIGQWFGKIALAGTLLVLLAALIAWCLDASDRVSDDIRRRYRQDRP